jgi:hypothetical protein
VAVLNPEAGYLNLAAPDGTIRTIFPAGASVWSATWSPDGTYLLVVLSAWEPPQANDEPVVRPPELWRVEFDGGAAGEPHMIFRLDEAEATAYSAAGRLELTFGTWSPDARRVVFWAGASGSMRADGNAPFVIDVASGQVVRAADWALVNPRYHSWSPDSSTVAITVGGGRSAQANKWLNLVNLETGTVTTVVSMTAQIPGIVAWSPQGDQIAYAAVAAAQDGTAPGDDRCCPILFTNPAIANRRIYLVDVASSATRPLNDDPVFQDAPIWQAEGAVLEYVQWDAAGETLVLMQANPETGEAQPIEATRRPASAADTLVGYYGQSAWEEFFDR